MADNGLNMNLYIDAAGVGQGTNALLDIVEDVTVNGTRNTGTVKNRASGDEKKLAGQRVRSIDLTMTYEPTNTVLQALRANYEADDGSYVGVLAMDGPIPAVGSDSVGLQMDCIVTEWTHAQPLEDSSTIKCKLEPAATSTFEPAVTTVTPA